MGKHNADEGPEYVSRDEAMVLAQRIIARDADLLRRLGEMSGGWSRPPWSRPPFVRGDSRSEVAVKEPVAVTSTSGYLVPWMTFAAGADSVTLNLGPFPGEEVA